MLCDQIDVIVTNDFTYNPTVVWIDRRRISFVVACNLSRNDKSQRQKEPNEKYDKESDHGDCFLILIQKATSIHSQSVQSGVLVTRHHFSRSFPFFCELVGAAESSTPCFLFVHTFHGQPLRFHHCSHIKRPWKGVLGTPKIPNSEL